MKYEILVVWNPLLILGTPHKEKYFFKYNTSRIQISAWRIQSSSANLAKHQTRISLHFWLNTRLWTLDVHDDMKCVLLKISATGVCLYICKLTTTASEVQEVSVSVRTAPTNFLKHFGSIWLNNLHRLSSRIKTMLNCQIFL